MSTYRTKVLTIMVPMEHHTISISTFMTVILVGLSNDG